MRDLILRSNFLAKSPALPARFTEFSPENSPAADREVTRG
jgi:hypothetical protein